MFLRLLQEMSSFSNTFASSAHGSWIPLSCQSVFNGAMLSLLGSMSYCLIPEKVLLSRMIEVGHWENCLFCKLFLGCLYLEQIECLEHINRLKTYLFSEMPPAGICTAAFSGRRAGVLFTALCLGRQGCWAMWDSSLT